MKKASMREEPKELSSREKAKLFARNIPRPKPKRVDDAFDQNQDMDPNMLT
jgi:hypothetical protein